MKKTRREAIENGDRYYATGEPCINGHNSKRTTRDGSCLECRLSKQRDQRKQITSKCGR